MHFIKKIIHFLFILGLAGLISALQKNTKSNQVNLTATTIKMTKYNTINTTKLPSTKTYELIKTTNKIVQATMANTESKSNFKIFDSPDIIKDTRRAKNTKKGRSTSSSSGSESEEKTSKSGKESLEMSTSSSSSEDLKKRSHNTPKSSSERKGWRKWHRKCDKCEEDMNKIWRDHSIAWICGAYQRARRSFKSECMMHYRNCQDGTMFVKIHDHKCKNDSYHGFHFFYDYKVPITDKSSSSGSSATSSSESIGESSGFRLESDETDKKSSREKKPRKKITKFMDVTARVSYT